MDDDLERQKMAARRGRKQSIAALALDTSKELAKTIRRLSQFGLVGGAHLDFQLQVEDIERLNEDRGNREVLKELGGTTSIVEKLCGNAEAGLPDEQSGVLVRQKKYGCNQYKELPPKSFWALLMEEYEDRVLQLLMFAALISTVLGVAVEEQRKEKAWVDGIAIWTAVIAVSLLGACNNFQKERQFKTINQQRDAIDVTVLRSGREKSIPSFQVVVGDVMLVDTGDRIAGDGLLLKGNDLVVDEASLTGESEPVLKDSAKDPFVWTGTQVSEGSGQFLVTAVGERSEWGKTMALVVGESEDTPLQLKLTDLAMLIGKVGTGVAVMCFVVLAISHFIESKTFKLEDVYAILDFFMFAVTIIVVAVPEGLPLAVTISLAYSMMKMMKDNNFVRVLEACETMGGATAICSDKTGTLTENRMTVMECWTGEKRYAAVPNQEEVGPVIRNLMSQGVSLNSKAHLIPKDDDPRAVDFVGNRTECALLTMLKNWGIDYKPIRKAGNVAKLLQFTSERKMSSIVVREGDSANKMVLYSKGAAEILLRRCDKIVTKDGSLKLLDDSIRTDIEQTIDSLASRGLRTLSLAYREVSGAEDLGGEEDIERDLTLVMIVGIKDPLRQETAGAVAQCKSAGITVRMVTGDNLKTAQHIAKECGIYFGDGICLEGQVFRAMAEEELLPILPKLQVLARSSPSDKLQLVRLLKKQGEVVAVTGDGTNDAPALKESNVGLSMGKTGTEVAKEASDIVILDDNFNSIVKSVVWGRSIFRNIRKFLQFQITINFVALALSFVACVAQKGMPLTVLQLLWVNLIMDSMAALALATEKPTEDLLLQKPHGHNEPLINKDMLRHIFVQGLYQLAVLIFILFALENMNGLAPQYKLPRNCEVGLNEVLNTTGYETFTASCVNQTEWVAECTALNTNVLSYLVPQDCKIALPVRSVDCGDVSLPCQEFDVLTVVHDHLKDDYEHAKEIAQKRLYSFLFNAFIFMQIFNEINSRKIANEYNVFEGFHESPIFLGVILSTIAVQVVIMETSLAKFFELRALNWQEWVGSLGIGLLGIPISLLTKFVIKLDWQGRSKVAPK